MANRVRYTAEPKLPLLLRKELFCGRQQLTFRLARAFGAITDLVELAKVCRFFVVGNLGKRFFALFGYTGLVMTAVNASAQLGAAVRALVAAAHLIGDDVQSLSTLSTPRHWAGIRGF